MSESKASQFIFNVNDTTAENTVPCTVESYDFDHQFIVVKQKDSPNCLDEGLNAVVRYWIIDKTADVTYGPLNLFDFNNKKKELEVSTALNLSN